jgi:molecular chaperone DnaK (HSP70)
MKVHSNDPQRHQPDDRDAFLPAFTNSELSSAAAGSAQQFVGIDLGTTNSIAAVADGVALLRGDVKSAVRLISVRQKMEYGAIDSPLFPSLVAEVRPGSWLAGAGAKEMRRRGLRKDRQIFYSTKLDTD